MSGMDMEGWGYVIVPSRQFTNRREKMIYMCLLEEAAFAPFGSLKIGEAMINVAELAREASIDVKKVRYSLSKLEESGFIKTRRLKQNKGIIVTIVDYVKLQNTKNYGKKSETVQEETSAQEEQQEDEKKMKSNAFVFFEDEGFGLLSSFMAEKLNSLIDDYGEDKVLEAMKEAVTRNARNLAYVQRILQSNKNKSKEWQHGNTQNAKYRRGNGSNTEEAPRKVSPIFGGVGRVRRKG
ncbi:DnaD domain protein [Bacillus subtilis]|nr:DnaD domain protein [Bacillus subtilis]